LEQLRDAAWARQQAFDALEHRRCGPMTDERAADARRHPLHDARRPLDVADAQFLGLGVARIEETGVVEREADLLREGEPRLLRRRWCPTPGDVRELGRKALDERLPAEALLLVGEQMHLMPSRGELANDRLE